MQWPALITEYRPIFKLKGNKQSNESKESVELTISAAASLKDAMEVIQSTYQEEHPEVTLKFNFGGSGSLQQQISQGAPVDLFFSAAEDKFDVLVEEKYRQRRRSGPSWKFTRISCT